MARAHRRAHRRLGPRTVKARPSKLRANLKDWIKHLLLAPAPALGQFKANVKALRSEM